VRSDGLHEAIRVINGKRVAFRGHSDLDVERKMIAYKSDVERGKMFHVEAEEWKDYHFKKLAYNTVKGYESSFNRCVKYFKDKSIKEVKPQDIDRFLKYLNSDRVYSNKTITTHMNLLNMIFNYAIVNGDIEINPCTGVSAPQGKQKVPRMLPSDSDIKIIQNDTSFPFGLLHYFLLYSGLRKGEALALQYGDIDRETKTITVNKSLYWENCKFKIKTPKTAAGYRKVILLDELANKIPKGAKDKYVFFKGDPLRRTTFDYHLDQYRKQKGITCTFHQLRHAYATILFEAGIDEKSAQELLGHTSIAMTRDLYTHISKQKHDKTAAILNSYVSSQHNGYTGDAKNNDK